MKYRLLAGVCLAALAGCTTATDMLKREPVFFGHTTRSPQEYAECVADAWRRQGENPKVSPTEYGVDVTLGSVTGMAAALRVQKWANGRVEIRMSARSSFGSRDLVQAANLCM